MFVIYLTVNESEEWFYKLKRAMLLRIVENEIKEGEMFLLPATVLSTSSFFLSPTPPR
jgi:hypothetical protein